MAVVTALRATRRGRVAVYVDGDLVCAVGEAAVARWRLYKGRTLDDADLSRLVDEASRELTLGDAYRLLGHRARSTAELRRRLLARDHAPEAVEAVLRSLSDDGLLDDAAFARSYVADKRRLAGWGTERIRRGLADAGVAGGDIDAALSAGATGEAVDDADAEVLRALDLLARRERTAGRPDEAARRRAYQFLLRRGFASGVAYAAVRTWSGATIDHGDASNRHGETEGPATA